MAERLRRRVEEMGDVGQQTHILGPAPAFFARHRGFYRWQILLRAVEPAYLLQGMAIPFGWRVDVDPVSLL
jgi:primosomal protein N' (replication factor Y)